MHQARLRHPSSSRRSGFALVAVLLLGIGLASLGLAAAALTSAAVREQQSARRSLAARYVADAGLSDAVARMRAGRDSNVGSANVPVEFGGGRYWVEASVVGGDLTSLVCTGEQDGAVTRVELLVREARSSMWALGAFGEESMHLNSNAFVDSYDSTSPWTYEEQVSRNGGSFAADNVAVGSNGDIRLRSNSQVHGDANPGPGGTVTILGNASVTGSTSPSASYFNMPALDIPPIPTLVPLDVRGLLPVVLPPGQHGFTDFRARSNSSLVVVGPATVVLDTFRMDSNSTFTADTTLGPVEVYVRGSFIIDSNVVVRPTSMDPSALSFGLWTNNIAEPDQLVLLDQIGLDSNATMVGTLFAPRAHVHMDSNFELFGAVVARRLSMDSNSRVHYDERLQDVEGDEMSVLESLAWRILPREGN